MNTLLYTFRSCELGKGVYKSVIVLGELRNDILSLEQQIQHQRPDWVIGIGNSNTTRYETIAVNQFQKNKRILDDGPVAYPLLVPETQLPVASTASTSFCNWSAYRLVHYVATHQLTTLVTFLHVAPTDEDVVNQELTRLGVV